MGEALMKVVHDANTITDELNCGMITEHFKRRLFSHRFVFS